MEKIKKFLTELRFEYKVLGFFVILALLYFVYSFIKAEFFPDGLDLSFRSKSSISTGANNKGSSSVSKGTSSSSSSSSISDAVSADRPIIISESQQNQPPREFEGIIVENPEIKFMEYATQVTNPTVWVYVNNDGLRKDDLAARYCKALHNRGIMASTVTIYDERERAKGRLVELGDYKCM